MLFFGLADKPVYTMTNYPAKVIKTILRAALSNGEFAVNVNSGTQFSYEFSFTHAAVLTHKTNIKETLFWKGSVSYIFTDYEYVNFVMWIISQTIPDLLWTKFAVLDDPIAKNRKKKFGFRIENNIDANATLFTDFGKPSNNMIIQHNYPTFKPGLVYAGYNMDIGHLLMTNKILVPQTKNIMNISYYHSNFWYANESPGHKNKNKTLNEITAYAHDKKISIPVVHGNMYVETEQQKTDIMKIIDKYWYTVHDVMKTYRFVIDSDNRTQNRAISQQIDMKMVELADILYQDMVPKVCLDDIECIKVINFKSVKFYFKNIEETVMFRLIS